MRQRVWAIWERSGWVLLLAALAAVYALGFIGLDLYARQTAADWSLPTRLYLAATLFVFDNGALSGQIPWPLEIARWLAPLVLATAAVGTVVSLVRRSVGGWGARSRSGHTIVVGLGERGWRIASAAHRAGRRVVAVEVDPDNSRARMARRLGIPVVVGSGADPAKLRAAGITRAARMIVVVPDAESAAVADAVAAVEGAGPGDVLRAAFCCYLVVADAEAARHLNGLLHAQGTPVRREFLSLENRAGPVIVDRWGGFLGTLGAPGPIVVVGGGAVARSVVGAAIRQRQARRAPGDGQRLRIRWLCRDGAERDAVRAAIPTLAADLDGVDLHVAAPDATGISALLSGELAGGETPALVVIGDGTDAGILGTVAIADAALAEARTPIVAIAVRPGLVSLLRDHRRIAVFELLAELCDDETIADGQLDAMARALHDGYLRQLDRTLPAAARAERPAYRPWDDLPSALRDQNYDAARAMWEQLRGLGFDVVARNGHVGGIRAFDADTVEALARAEHERWFARRHPGEPTPDWAGVDPVHAEQSRDQARRIPTTLSTADLQVTRISPQARV